MRGRHLALLFAAFALLEFLRRPATVLHAGLWGDEGWAFYPDAYYHGLRSLLIPDNGYLNTLQRLVAIAAQPVPLHLIPAVFVLAALAVQIAPPLFLISDRMAAAWPHRSARSGFALILLVMPDQFEFFLNLTNAQWNLALLAFLVLVSSAPASWAGRLFDTLVLLICGLSGPFCVLMAPIAVWRLLPGPRRVPGWRWRSCRLAVLALTSAIQAGVLYLSDPGVAGTLGAGPRLLARVLCLQLFMGAELGYLEINALVPWFARQGNALPIGATLIGVAIFAWGLWRGSALLRQFSLLAALVLVGGLMHPHVSSTMPQWRGMLLPPAANRYFAYGVIAWIGVLCTLAARPSWPPRLVGGGLLAVLLLYGVPHDWAQTRWPRTDFAARAMQFEAAPPGTRMTFPLIIGDTMVLVKKAPWRRSRWVHPFGK